jgi:rubrerythrin
MTFEKIKDVLKQARGFHRQLSEFYSSLSNRSGQQRVKMMLDYICQQEIRLEDSLSRYEEQLSEKLLDANCQDPPPQETLKVCKDVIRDIKGDLTVDEVIAMVVKMDQCLIDLYKDAVEKAESDNVREIFNNLVEMERRYQLEWVRAAQEWKDV